MLSSKDHGFNADWTITVQANDTFRHRSAEGLAEMRVYRRHRDPGFWECAFLSGPRAGAIWVRREADILADMKAS